MRPLSLQLKNFIGIRDGLGRDTIELDIEALTGNAQLIALTGPNGTGKSTILDNLSPFRVAPSRASGYTTGSFSYWDNVYGDEASKVLIWEHDGRRYRSTLLFKLSGKSKKAEAYLHELPNIAALEWRPVTLPDNTVSDGKADTYDACVDHILGSPQMFFSSVFSAQGRRSLSAYSNGEIKGLMSELLGLDHIRQLGDKAAQTTKLMRAKLDGIRHDVTGYDALLAAKTAALADIDNNKASLGLYTQSRFACKQAVLEHSGKMADLRAAANAEAETEARRARLMAQLTGATQRAASSVAQILADIAALERRRFTSDESLERERSLVGLQIAAAHAQIKAAHAIVAQKDAIAAATTEQATLPAQEMAARTAVDVARAADAQRVELLTARDRIAADMVVVQNDGAQLAAQCDALTHRTLLATKVPCGGTDFITTCPLLQDVRTAQAAMPAATAAIAAKRATYRERKLAHEAMEQQIAAFTDTDTGAALRAADAALRQLQTRARELASTAGLSVALHQANSTISHAQEQIANLGEALRTKATETAALLVDLAAQQTQLSARKLDTEASAAFETTAIRAEIDALPPTKLAEAVEAADALLAAAEQAFSEAERNIEEINGRVGAVKERLAGIERDLARLQSSVERARRLEAEIAYWVILTKALGNDGVVSLCIDDAGPTLAGITNDLLLACYGPRFSVRIDTQREAANGNLKEAFDIIVFDADGGSEKSLAAMSGGERVWINEALARAIALYQAQASGRQYETLFSDESDGALDADKKHQFIKMKRKVLALGNYRSEIFISHTPALWDLADAVIDLTKFKLN